MRTITSKEVITTAKSDDKTFWFRGWGMYADESELVVVLECILSESNTTTVSRLLRVFSNRNLPSFDPRIIELCRHVDPEVRRWSLTALAKNSDTRVREFALSEFEKLQDPRVLDLLVKNFVKGDEQMLFDSINLPDGDFELHGMLSTIRDILEANLEADCRSLGIASYALTPCELCRYDLAKLLITRHVMPEWMSRECTEDSHEPTRKLVSSQDN